MTAAARAAHADIPFWGIDLDPADRPGVPYEHAPRPVPGAHWIKPARQIATVPVLKAAGVERLTPVFGTATPPHGLSGVLRRVAYRAPDHLARHWLLLLVADRVDAIESDLGGFARRALPAAALVTAVGVGLGVLRQRRRRARVA
ncbi:Hypothetical protein A7982_04084 [Minicystis rosea]|nr:Hypothetical protein A7982_04084 [Minicystis rosea]